MIKKILIGISSFFVIFFLSADNIICTFNNAEKTPEVTVRVAVAKDAPRLSLKVKGPYKISTLHTNQLIEEAAYLEERAVLPAMSGIKLGEKEFKIYGIKIVPKKDASIYINGRRFRGSIDIIRTENLKLLAVNHIDVEDYLRGVLYHEVSHWWPMEALKAQAIASRTYAIYQAQERKTKDYDLTSDVYSQVYGGRFSEKWRTDQAVLSTRGKVLTYKAKIFPTYYHATCGGYTEDASNLWNIDLPPLKGTRCSFCRNSPHYHWKKNAPFSAIESKLKEAGFKIGRIDSINTVGRLCSNRVKDVELHSSTATLTISAKDFRAALGSDFIRSTNFKLNTKGSVVLFEGYGWGHGVGMCQWGAYFMAKRNFKTVEILNFYYPGTQIENYKETSEKVFFTD